MLWCATACCALWQHPRHTTLSPCFGICMVERQPKFTKEPGCRLQVWVWQDHSCNSAVLAAEGFNCWHCSFKLQLEATTVIFADVNLFSCTAFNAPCVHTVCGHQARCLSAHERGYSTW